MKPGMLHSLIQFRNAGVGFKDGVAEGHTGGAMCYQPVPQRQRRPDIVFVVGGDSDEVAIVAAVHVTLVLHYRASTLLDVVTAFEFG